MKNPICVASNCSYCRSFSPDGCKHGYCRNLSVQVEANWSPCALFVAAFDRAERQQRQERDFTREPIAA